MYDEKYDENIDDGEFEEIPEREVISMKDLSPEDADKLTKQLEESKAVSAEEAAKLATEIEADVDAMAKPTRPLTQREMIQAVSNATGGGGISKSRKQSILREMGIFKSTFTKKSTSKPAKTNKRKAARKARRKNR